VSLPDTMMSDEESFALIRKRGVVHTNYHREPEARTFHLVWVRDTENSGTVRHQALAMRKIPKETDSRLEPQWYWCLIQLTTISMGRFSDKFQVSFGDGSGTVFCKTNLRICKLAEG
jgi:hypothetical protein